MDRLEIQNRLESLYQRWKKELPFKEPDVAEFSPPLLLKVTADYCTASPRIIVYGQETKGWEWTHCLKELYPDYPKNWPFRDLRNFWDFISNDDAIEGLIWGYEQFDFAAHQPRTRGSPFWRAFRSIQEMPGSGMLWSNLLRVDYLGGSSVEQQGMLKLQHALLRDELKILAPNACVFFTGPNYETVLRNFFPGIGCEPIGTPRAEELAKLVHDDLPVKSFRTYHPQALTYQGKQEYLNEIIKAISQ